MLRQFYSRQILYVLHIAMYNSILKLSFVFPFFFHHRRAKGHMFFSYKRWQEWSATFSFEHLCVCMCAFHCNANRTRRELRKLCVRYERYLVWEWFSMTKLSQQAHTLVIAHVRRNLWFFLPIGYIAALIKTYQKCPSQRSTELLAYYELEMYCRPEILIQIPTYIYLNILSLWSLDILESNFYLEYDS